MAHMIRWQPRPIATGTSLTYVLSLFAFFLPALHCPAAEPVSRNEWLRDDAPLLDVAVAGTRSAWAVGARGIILHSADAGQTWASQDSGTVETLRSVCFLTDQIGWAAGGDPASGTRAGLAVLLATRDSGATWTPMTTGLPIPIAVVRFFDFQEGVAIAASPSPLGQTAFRTQDGGATWQPIEDVESTAWRAASLTMPDLGLLGGQGGRVTLLAGDRLLPSRLPPMGRRSVRDLHLQASDRGWLVGDGGLLMTSETGGAVWEEPNPAISSDLRLSVNWRAVDARGDSVWIAGQPGSLVARSDDAGKSWRTIPTNQSLPLTRLRMFDDQAGLAVGELGAILRTQDGGRTWSTVRGKDRRLAVLNIVSRPQRIDWPVLVKHSGEDGYRSKVWIATGEDESDVPVAAAVAAAGAQEVERHWLWTPDKPSLDKDQDLLIAEWQRRSEGRLGEALIEQLVVQIRSYQPRVVVLEQPPADDALAAILNDAAKRAIAAAADPTRLTHLSESLYLSPWRVDRVYERLGEGSRGEYSIDEFELLPSSGGHLRQLVLSAAARAGGEFATPTVNATYRSIDTGTPQEGGRGFFGNPTADDLASIRRPVLPSNPDGMEDMLERTRRQRNLAAVARKQFDDVRLAAQMLGELPEILRGLPSAEGAAVLSDLARQHRSRRQFELAAEVYLELYRRYPQDPAATEAAAWLLTYVTSAEMTWQRARNQTAEIPTPRRTANTILPVAGTQPDAGPLGFDARLEAERQSISQIVRSLSEVNPAVAQSRDLECSFAALCRSRGKSADADAVYRQFVRLPNNHPWRNVVDREIWLSQPFGETPTDIAVARRADSPPVLDGLLSDTCWQAALPIRFRATGNAIEEAGSTSFALLTFDNEFLYWGASITRDESRPVAETRREGRQHDAPDLDRHDHVRLRLDIERDYASYYEFRVDQRGETAESLWDDTGWNPEWFVAVDADATRWTIEAAIPWTELASHPPRRGDHWGLSIIRSIPGVRWEGMPPFDKAANANAATGLVRFE
jgi:photosystem II stability/assembly factor-like uncharacterized protein